MNMTLFHRIQFSVGDSAFFAELPGGETVLLVRDIEMDRAKRLAQADRIGCAADYMPAGGLDGDRDTALAAFDDLAADIPALKEFKLVGASYSGEISLAYTLPAGVDATRGRIEEIRTRILSIDGVAYADPDFVAHPGEDKRK